MTNSSKNIVCLYGIRISKWFNLVMPVVVLFYQDNGMGMHEIFLLKSVYSVAIVALELPSGWMADAWGRKKTLLLGAILGSLGFLFYSFSNGFGAFIIAEIILGAGYSFVSGADSAMLFESLKAGNRPDQYVKHEGRLTSAGNFAEALAGIAAGFLAAISLRTPFYFQFVVATLAIPAALMLTEPRIKAATAVISARRMFHAVKNSLLKNTNLRVALLLSSATGTATLTFAWLVQPFFKEVGMPVEWFGILWTVLNLSAGISSFYAHRFEGRIGYRKEVILMVLLLTMGFVLPGTAIMREGMIFLFLFYFVRGVATVVFKNYINQYTPDDIRATILSVRNFVIRMSFAVIGPLLGWMTDYVNLNMAFITAGSIYFVAAVGASWPWLWRGQH